MKQSIIIFTLIVTLLIIFTGFVKNQSQPIDASISINEAVETQTRPSVTPTSQTYGRVQVGSSANRDFTVKSGSFQLNGTVDIDGPGESEFSCISGCAYSLPGGGHEQVVTIQFHPSSVGNFGASVDFGGGLTGFVGGSGTATK